MKLIFAMFLLFPCLIASAQTSKAMEKKLKNVVSIDDVDELIEHNQDWHIELLDLQQDDPELNASLKNMKAGQIVTVKEGEETFVYKLFEADPAKRILTFIKVRCED